jgi:hypothetical protein
MPTNPPGDGDHQRHLQQRADEVGEAVDAEQALEALDGIDARGIGGELLGGEEHAVLDDVAAGAGEHRPAHHRQQYGREGHRHLPGHRDAFLPLQVDRVRMGDERGQLLGEGGRHAAAAHRQRGEGAGQRERLGQLHRLGDVAVLARLFEPVRGGFFGA